MLRHTRVGVFVRQSAVECNVQAAALEHTRPQMAQALEGLNTEHLVVPLVHQNRLFKLHDLVVTALSGPPAPSAQVAASQRPLPEEPVLAPRTPPAPLRKQNVEARQGWKEGEPPEAIATYERISYTQRSLEKGPSKRAGAELAQPDPRLPQGREKPGRLELEKGPAWPKKKRVARETTWDTGTRKDRRGRRETPEMGRGQVRRGEPQPG